MSQSSCIPTGYVTLVIVDVASRVLVGVATYPNMGGPGKINHGPRNKSFFDNFCQINKEESNCLVDSLHHASQVEVTRKYVYHSGSAREKTSSSLLGDNSILHPLLRMPCDFKKLDRPLNLCGDY
jgi:hypothetical protein